MTELEQRLALKEKEEKSSLQKRYDDILSRIVKGAEFIESINESHPQWKAAHQKYNQLCDELIKVRAML